MLTSRSTDLCASHGAKSLKENRYVRKSRFESRSAFSRPATSDKAVQFARRRKSPQRGFGALGPAAVVRFAAQSVLTQARDHFARARKRLGVDVLFGVPQLRAHQRARTLKIDGVDANHDHR